MLITAALSVVLTVLNLLLLTCAGFLAFLAGNEGFDNYGPSGTEPSGWGIDVHISVVWSLAFLLACVIVGAVLFHVVRAFQDDNRALQRCAWAMFFLLILFAGPVAVFAFIWRVAVTLSGLHI